MIAGRGDEIRAGVGRGQFGIDRLAGLADAGDRRADFVDLAAAEFEVFDAEPDGRDLFVGLGLVEPLDQLAQRGLHVAEQSGFAGAFRIFAAQGEANDRRQGLAAFLAADSAAGLTAFATGLVSDFAAGFGNRH